MGNSTLISPFTKANFASFGQPDRTTLAALVVAIFILWLGSAIASAHAGEQPNILLLLSDDHCYRALGCAGNQVVRTPNLDRLAAEGVYFSHCFTPMPQCSPSRAALFTGQDSWTNGVRSGSTPFAADAILWPRLLADAGYEVFYTGKWHNVGMPWNHGFTCGANIYAGGMSDHRQMALLQWGESKEQRKKVARFSTSVFADSAIEFLETRHESRPFCAMVSFTAPHDPWVPPSDFAALYSPDGVDLPANFMPRPPFKTPPDFATLRDQKVLPFPRTEDGVRHATALYYGMISHLDYEIGRILDALDRTGMAENTLVIFAGDHGYSLGSHGFVGKQCMYDEGIRLPLIVRFPGQQNAAATNSELVSLIDLFPTICAAAGLEVPAPVEGTSLVPLYVGEPTETREFIFASHHSPSKHHMSTQCIRTKDHKLIEHRLTGEFELFDIRRDPLETHNLIGHREVDQVEQRLRSKLAQWESTHHEQLRQNR